LETITVAASRINTTSSPSEMALLVGAVLVVAVVVWMVLSGVKRNRQQPRA
jgi:hypothetical protein